MNEAEWNAFLQWALPRVGLRWRGYRRVRALVRKRLRRRMRELGIAGLAQYRCLLEREAAEQQAFDALCRIPISRFWRDRAVFAALAERVLPALAARALAEGRVRLRAWSAGCASGEEPYSVAILWRLALSPRFPALELELVATDADPVLLERARRGCYGPGSLAELPREWIAAAFERAAGRSCLREPFRRGVCFALQDIRAAMPRGLFDLVLCRNLVFTYFEAALQERVGAALLERLRPGGVLAIGVHERIPPGLRGLEPLTGAPALYEKRAGAPSCQKEPTL